MDHHNQPRQRPASPLYVNSGVGDVGRANCEGRGDRQKERAQGATVVCEQRKQRTKKGEEVPGILQVRLNPSKFCSLRKSIAGLCPERGSKADPQARDVYGKTDFSTA